MRKTDMTVKNIKRLCVYCGSGPGTNPLYVQEARILGRALAEAGIGLVYGAGGNGLMGTIARTAVEHGGHVTGIIPASLIERENAFEGLSDRHVVASLHERKMMMYSMSDGFVALPGGLGTLEELVEQLTWVQLGHHGKPVIIVNTAGYWNLLLELFEQMRETRFIREGLETQYEVVEDAADVVPVFLDTQKRAPAVATSLVSAR
jgi:uncharacterized protein (TIGR00730 family)